MRASLLIGSGGKLTFDLLSPTLHGPSRRHELRSVTRLDQVRPGRPGLERIAKILRFVGDLSVAEFHDAHRVRRHAVITEHEFSDPKVTVADDPLDGEALLARLHRSALLNLAAAANAFARLRIVEHRILAIDLMLDREIIRIRWGPVAFERSAYLAIFHLVLPSRFSSLHRGSRSRSEMLRS